MWTIHVFGTLQCIVPAVQELLGACTVLYMEEGYSMSGGGRGGVMVSVCMGVGRLVGGCCGWWCDVQECMLVGVMLLYGLPVICETVVICLVSHMHACLFGASLKFTLSQWMWRGRGCLLPMGLGCCAWQGALAGTTPEGPSIS